MWWFASSIEHRALAQRELRRVAARIFEAGFVLNKMQECEQRTAAAGIPFDQLIVMAVTTPFEPLLEDFTFALDVGIRCERSRLHSLVRTAE